MIFMILYLIILNIGTDFTLKTAQSSLASWIPIPDNIYELVPLASAYVYWRPDGYYMIISHHNM